MWMLLFIIIILFYFWIRDYYKYFERLGIPFVIPKFPLGSTTNVGRTEHMSDFMRREYEKFKNKEPIFGFFFLFRPVIVPTQPELIKEILTKNFEIFYDHGIELDFHLDPLSRHLFFMKGEEWRDLRAKLTSTFTSGKMKLMFPIIASTADHMVKYLTQFVEKEEECEVKEVFASFTMEIIASVAFGLQIDCHGKAENEFKKVSNRVFHPTAWEKFKLFILFSFPKLGSKLKFSLNSKETIDFFTKCVSDNMEHRERNQIKRNDFFQLMINLKNSDSGMTSTEMAGYCFGFFVAGFETSSSAMTFLTYELALNQDIQHRLREEIEDVLSKYDGEVTYNSILEMKYLDMVFKETIRKYPVLEVQHRKAAKDFKIPNTKLIIPAGAYLMLPIVGIHNDERFYKNPDKFDPERFSEENINNLYPYSYVPFSEGPRNCLGLRFGTMQTKLGIIKLIRAFKILPCKKTSIPMKFCPTSHLQSPFGGLYVKLEKLSQE